MTMTEPEDDVATGDGSDASGTGHRSVPATGRPGGAGSEPVFISEPVTPDAGTFDTARMSQGVAGLPAGFTWRGRRIGVRQVLEEWKESEAEGHRPGNERYYRKHCFRLEGDDGDVYTLYVLRQVKAGESQKRRWWLYTVERRGPEEPTEPGAT